METYKIIRIEGGMVVIFTKSCCTIFFIFFAAHAKLRFFYGGCQRNRSMNHTLAFHSRYSRFSFTSCTSLGFRVHALHSQQSFSFWTLTFSCCSSCSEDASDSDLSESGHFWAWSRCRGPSASVISSSLSDMQLPLSSFRFALLTARCGLACMILLWMEFNEWKWNIKTEL